MGGVLIYDALSPDGQTLSEGVDRALETNKCATLCALGITALHLANGFEYLGIERYDPFRCVMNYTRKLVHNAVTM